MATITKPNTFSASTLIQSSQVNANFDVLYERLSGAAASNSIEVFSTDGSHTPLVVKQTSTGNSQEWQDTSGTTKLQVTQVGVIESLITTGTAPMVVASSTKVDNLNADQVDGLESTDIVQVSGGVVNISHDDPKIVLDETEIGGREITLEAGTTGGKKGFLVSDSVSGDLFEVDSDGDATLLGRLVLGYNTPSNEFSATPRNYVDERTTPFAIVAFFPGSASTDAARPSFVVPNSANTFTYDRLTATFQAGNNSATTLLRLYINGVSAEGVQLIGGEEDVGDVKVNNITDAELMPGDVVHFQIEVAGSHADVTVQLEGSQKHN